VRTRFFLAPAVAAAVIAACNSSGVIGPSNQLQVTNAADDFQFQVSKLAKVSQTLQYTWTNTGDSANVNQASALTAGAATLTIRDPAATVVYQADLTKNGTFHTAKATTGAWTIEVNLANVNGVVNFRVQKAP
jgi:hypothetical protein